MSLWISKQTSLLVELAVKDLWHDRKISLCIGASLVAVVAPLLLLFGLKYGVVNQLQQNLLSDPRNLEIRMTNSGVYNIDWLADIRDRSETGFVLGLTRSLNTLGDLIGDAGKFTDNAELIPTAEGDPLLATPLSDLENNETILSANAAKRLAVKAGDTIRLAVLRKLDGRSERGQWLLRVVAVLQPARFTRPAAFIHPTMLLQVEYFRDGFIVPQSGITSGRKQPPAEARYARARIYTKSIDEVASLEHWLNSQDIETSSRLADIENVKAINYVLSVIFAVISAAAVTGCAVSLSGAFLANVDRKRRNLAVLRLMGLDRRAVVTKLIIQALVLSFCGFVIGLALYMIGSNLFNHILGVSGQSFVCEITVLHMFISLILAITLAVFISLIGAWRANRIHPAESLREI